jgi:hypothetical protein
MIMYILFAVLMGLNVMAGETSKVTSSVSSPTTSKEVAEVPIELNSCKPTIAATGHEEDSARLAAKEARLSESEILARIIYSETLSTGYWNGTCEATSDEALMKNVGWGLIYRISKTPGPKADAFYSAIFKVGQFRTSFSSISPKPPSDPYLYSQDFLCPLHSQGRLGESSKFRADVLFRKAQKIAKDLVNIYNKDGVPSPYNRMTNFSTPHPRFLEIKDQTGRTDQSLHL